MDAEQLREYGHKMVDFIADYYKTIENFPVLSQVETFKQRYCQGLLIGRAQIILHTILPIAALLDLWEKC